MPNYHYDLQQGSDAWLEARLGIPTASEFDRIITPAKLGYAAGAAGYMAEKLAEWMAGQPLDIFEDAPPIKGWRERGQLLEPEAVRYYEMERDVETSKVGLVLTDDGMTGASPDRLVGDTGILEQKCPALKTHVGYMLEPASLVAEYRLQVQGQLWVCQREWCDMQSYYPGFPSVIIRVQREEKVQAALAQHIPAFVATMLECRAKLLATYGELRRERVGVAKAAEILESRRAAHDEWMDSPVGGVV